MSTKALEQELYKYLLLLNDAEKKSVLKLIKTFLGSRKEDVEERISIEEYNKEIDEAEAAIERGEFYTHEDVVEMSKSWLNGK